MVAVDHLLATFVRSLLSSQVTSRSTYEALFTNLRQVEDQNNACEVVSEMSEGLVPVCRKKNECAEGCRHTCSGTVIASVYREGVG